MHIPHPKVTLKFFARYRDLTCETLQPFYSD